MAEAKITFLFDGGETFECPRHHFVPLSVTISNLIDDSDGDTQVPINNNVSRATFEKVADYCELVTKARIYNESNADETNANEMNTDETNGDEMNVDDMNVDDMNVDWNKYQITDEWCPKSMDELLYLICAANYLDIKPLLELTCAHAAGIIKGKTPDEIRETFNIPNDLDENDLTENEQ